MQWGEFNNYLEDTRPNNIKVLCHNGWETFGECSSPLHNRLSTFKGEITVLIIDPDSEACKRRCESLDNCTLKKNGEKDYYEMFLTHHKHTIDFLVKLKKSNPQVKLYQYTQAPIWKIISTENYVWLQHYDTFKHSDDGPVYMFYKNKEKTSLFFAFIEVIPKIINDPGTSLIELKAV